jgi:hypothetical protein
MGRLLLVVSRKEPERYAYLQHILGSETVDVILDRRVEERRGRQTPVVVERRRAERRQRDITDDLRTLGWAVVRVR